MKFNQQILKNTKMFVHAATRVNCNTLKFSVSHIFYVPLVLDRTE